MAQETPLAKGTTLFAESDPPVVLHVLSGEIRVGDANSSVADVAAAGAAIGLAETLAGISLAQRARVTSDVWALRLTHQDLFDVLAITSISSRVYSAVFGRETLTHPSPRVPERRCKAHN